MAMLAVRKPEDVLPSPELLAHYKKRIGEAALLQRSLQGAWRCAARAHMQLFTHCR